jgi:hypothetical protein
MRVKASRDAASDRFLYDSENPRMLPPDDRLAICFAHVAYQLHEQFSALATGIGSFAVRDPESLMNRYRRGRCLGDLRAMAE